MLASTEVLGGDAVGSKVSWSLLEPDDDDDEDELDCELDALRFMEFGASRNAPRDSWPGDGTGLSGAAGRSVDPDSLFLLFAFRRLLLLRLLLLFLVLLLCLFLDCLLLRHDPLFRRVCEQ